MRNDLKTMMMWSFAAMALMVGGCFETVSTSATTAMPSGGAQETENQISDLDKEMADLDAKIKQAEQVLGVGGGGGAWSQNNPTIGGTAGIEHHINICKEKRQECEDKKRQLKTQLLIEKAKAKKNPAPAPEPAVESPKTEAETRAADQQSKVTQMETRIGQIDRKITDLQAKIKQAQHVLDIGGGGGAHSMTNSMLGGRAGIQVDIDTWTSQIKTLQDEKASIRQSLPKEKLILKTLQNKAAQEARQTARQAAGNNARDQMRTAPGRSSGGCSGHVD